LRAQTVHRLQIGMSGLAAMLLLVGLANIIMDRARQNEAERGLGEPTASASMKEEAPDPLADIGVAPSPSPSAKVPRPQ